MHEGAPLDPLRVAEALREYLSAGGTATAIGRGGRWTFAVDHPGIIDEILAEYGAETVAQTEARKLESQAWVLPDSKRGTFMRAYEAISTARMLTARAERARRRMRFQRWQLLERFGHGTGGHGSESPEEETGGESPDEG